MKAQEGKLRYRFTHFDLGPRWWWVVEATPWPLYPWEIDGTPCAGGWVGLGVSLDGYGRSHAHQGWSPGSSSLQQFTVLTALCHLVVAVLELYIEQCHIAVLIFKNSTYTDS